MDHTIWIRGYVSKMRIRWIVFFGSYDSSLGLRPHGSMWIIRYASYDMDQTMWVIRYGSNDMDMDRMVWVIS